MRVLMLADGRSIHTRRILEWHLKSGCEITFVDYFDPRPETADRYRFVRYPGLRGARVLKQLIGEQMVTRLNDRAVTAGLRHICRTFRPDVVHLYQIDTRAHHCYRAQLRPLVMSSWGTDINQHFRSAADTAYRRRTSEAIAGADFIIADADDIIDKCVTLAGRTVPSEVLPLGIDTKLFRAGYDSEACKFRRELGIPEDGVVLFSMRALTPLYGHDHILKAFHTALPRFKKRAFLVFKEYNNLSGDYREELHRTAERLGIVSEVRWSKSVPFARLPVLYAAADVIINYPSIDGFPVTFLEAAACKRPVITNRLPAYVGTFAEQCFRMVDPEDPSALANAISDAVNNVDLLISASLEQARSKVVECFDESVSVDRLMSIYRRLTGPSASNNIYRSFRERASVNSTNA